MSDDVVQRATEALFSAPLDVLAGYVSPLVVEVKRLRAREKALADRIDALRDQAGCEVRAREEWEANAIQALDEVERLRAQIAAVRELHHAEECGAPACEPPCPFSRHCTCGSRMPCPTIQALDGEATGA